MKKLLILGLCAFAAFAGEGYKVINKVKVGGTGGWDYLSVDPVTQRVFASHGGIVEVVDLKAGKVVGQITQLHGVHGIAVAGDVGKGFISNGQSNSVTIFDLKTLEKSAEPAVGGQNPDAICYEPKTQRIFTMNGRSNDATAINAKNNEIVATFPIGEKPEACVVDGAGKLYVNLENSAEVIEIDAAKPAVTRRLSISPCEGPSGLAIDTKNKKLFSVCSNKMMVVSDIATFKVVATPAIGSGSDGAAFDNGLAFSSNGEGTMSIVKLVNGKYETVDTVTTERGARTIALDPTTHRIYMLAAEHGPVPEAKEGKKGGGRPPVLPDSFHVLVIGK
jgi:DNA-binding beta-propeller fold protein YncE